MPKPDLPIFEIDRRLLETLTTQKRLALTAPTGWGKSTHVLQILLGKFQGQNTNFYFATLSGPPASRKHKLPRCNFAQSVASDPLPPCPLNLSDQYMAPVRAVFII